MGKVVDVIVASEGPIKDGPGLHGADIEGIKIYPGVQLQVLVDDPESPHDGWVQIVGPKPFPIKADGTFKDTGKTAWFKYSRLTLVGEEDMEFKLLIRKDGSVKSCVRVR